MFNEEFHLEQPIRWGMVGGGRGSQIGYIHRNSALRDRLFTLCAGAFDVNEERGREFGVNWGGCPRALLSRLQNHVWPKRQSSPDGIRRCPSRPRILRTMRF